MRPKTLLLIFQFITCSLFAQYAVFTIDTNQFYLNKDDSARFGNMSWIINGKPFAAGMPDVKIIPDPAKVDTILFRNSLGEEWHTILCNIRYAHTYTFSYNVCCGGFYLNSRAATDGIWSAEIHVQVLHPGQDIYRTSIDELYVETDQEQIDTLTYSYGAMDSKISWISLEKRTWKGSEHYHTPDQYVQISKFLYLPIDPEPFSMTYDTENGKLVLQ